GAVFLGLKTKTSPEGPAVHARYIVTFRPEAIGEVHQDAKRMKLDEAPGIRLILPCRLDVSCAAHYRSRVKDASFASSRLIRRHLARLPTLFA
ncbi:MAG TPA: hypothetical protein VNU65_06750, partial [Xanthobacteraceae bacterium]|nr:hypothetical protein [Xanthobacteraceae bacterium]